MALPPLPDVLPINVPPLPQVTGQSATNRRSTSCRRAFLHHGGRKFTLSTQARGWSTTGRTQAHSRMTGRSGSRTAQRAGRRAATCTSDQVSSSRHTHCVRRDHLVDRGRSAMCRPRFGHCNGDAAAQYLPCGCGAQAARHAADRRF